MDKPEHQLALEKVVLALRDETWNSAKGGSDVNVGAAIDRVYEVVNSYFVTRTSANTLYQEAVRGRWPTGRIKGCTADAPCLPLTSSRETPFRFDRREQSNDEVIDTEQILKNTDWRKNMTGVIVALQKAMHEAEKRVTMQRCRGGTYEISISDGVKSHHVCTSHGTPNDAQRCRHRYIAGEVVKTWNRNDIVANIHTVCYDDLKPLTLKELEHLLLRYIVEFNVVLPYKQQA